jgi:serine/threonine protein kinase
MEIPVKKISDQYSSIKFLGRGGYGEVILAENIIDNHLYAIKIIDINKNNKKIITETEREITILKKLSSGNHCHPNIVCYYDMFRDDSKLYIVMEYIPGLNLKETIKIMKKKYSDEQIYLILIIIIRDILLSLEYIHSQDVVHGDIKVENIIIREKENIYELDYTSAVLIDFGLSCQMDVPFSCHDSRGTPKYIDPELLWTERMKPANDIWSLGITILQSLDIDAWPIKYKNVKDFLNKMSRSSYTPSLKTSDSLLNLLVNSMLVRDLEERSTAKELLSMIEKSKIFN